MHRGVRSVWPRSPAPLGRGACKQAGGLSCPRASTEFPDVASPGAPTLCPARRQPLPPASPTSRSRRPRRAATRCGPAAQACRAVGGIPQTDLQVPPLGARCAPAARPGTHRRCLVPRAPVRSRALALWCGRESSCALQLGVAAIWRRRVNPVSNRSRTSRRSR